MATIVRTTNHRAPPRGGRTSVAVLALVGGLSAGCETLSARPFAGTLIEMTIAGAGESPPGTHLELWARSANDDIIRVNPLTDTNQHLTSYGLQIKLAVDPSDPCLIDDKGNLITTAAAYQTTKVAGVTQTPEQQAQTIQNRLDQILSTSLGGNQSQSLLAIVAASEGTRPTIAADASAADRLAACNAYWKEQPLAYSGNPRQITAPIHGVLYGFVTYTTTSPPAGYDGIRIETPVHLKGLRELWLTSETASIAAVDPKARGPVFLHSEPAKGGRGVVFFNLLGTSAAGTAALYVDLDDPGISF